MGNPLFTFEPGFFDDVCYGVNDDDVIGVFGAAFEDARVEIQHEIRHRARGNPEWKQYAEQISVGFGSGGFVVNYPESIAEEINALEYGRPDVPTQPVIRPALNKSAVVVAKRIESAVRV